MTPQDIHKQLNSINESLQEIFNSEGWKEILMTDAEHTNLEETLGDLLHYGNQLQTDLEHVLFTSIYG